MHDRQARAFDQHHEVNFSLNFPNIARFRVSAFTQRGSAGMVLRLIQQQIPTIDELNLPPILKDIAITPAGAGDFPGRHRLRQDHLAWPPCWIIATSQCREHIITVEDPIEFFHRHKQCLVDQREVGTDTDSYEAALKNTLRQAPNLIMIGEVRDRETMQACNQFRRDRPSVPDHLARQ
jgi:twitching motility protein PilU